MALTLVGINHNTAELAVREALAFAPAQLKPALETLTAIEGVDGAAILSTCNRTELYIESQSKAEDIIQWYAKYKAFPVAELHQCRYVLSEDAAIKHMMKVASGLDSMILGEPQILGQLKSAYAVAKDADCINTDLHYAFQQVFSVAKRVRSETAIGENPVSVAYAAVALAQQIFSDLKQDTALLIGAGETIELVAKYLIEKKIKNIIVANRTLSNAVQLAERFNGEAILLSDIPDELHRADIVIASTASQLPLLGKGAVEKALRMRKHKPVFMVDIAVPRDIESQVSELDDVYLYTVDDLKDVIDGNKKNREQAASIAEKIVDEGVDNFVRARREKNAAKTIVQVRSVVQDISQDVEQKALAQLKNGVAPEDVIKQLTRNLTNKFLHLPSENLKHAGALNDVEAIEKFKKIMTESLADRDKKK